MNNLKKHSVSRNCSDLSLLVQVISKFLETLGLQPQISEFFRSLEQFVQTVKGQNHFWQQNAFLTCSWMFIISNKLEQL